MAAILGGGWQPVPREDLLDEDAAWQAWDSAPDPVTRAAWFGLPAFWGAQATVLHLIRLGYQGAISLAARQTARRSSRGGHRGQHEPARAGEHRPCRWPSSVDEAARTPGQQAGAPGGHPRPSLLPGGRPPGHRAAEGPADRAGGPGPLAAGLAGAWEKLADAAIGLLRDLAAPTVADGQVSARKSRRDAAHALKAYLSYLGPAAGIASPRAGRRS